MGKKFFRYHIYLIMVILIITSVSYCNNKINITAGNERNIVLVLDISVSMIGKKGGKNIMKDVKDSVNKYIDTLQDGTVLTFITFGTEVKIYPSVFLDDDNDRDIIKKYIKMIDADEEWTYTSKMIKFVMDLSNNIQNKYPENNIQIVVMSDGLDNPPPEAKNDRFNLSPLAVKNRGQWVYILDFKKIN